MDQKKEESTLTKFVNEGVIEPTFKIDQEVFTANKCNECVETLRIVSIRIELHYIAKYNSLIYFARRIRDGHTYGYMEEDLFATREEAEKRLKEII